MFIGTLPKTPSSKIELQSNIFRKFTKLWEDFSFQFYILDDQVDQGVWNEKTKDSKIPHFEPYVICLFNESRHKMEPEKTHSEQPTEKKPDNQLLNPFLLLNNKSLTPLQDRISFAFF
jgi:hypothetical protein